MDQYRSVLEVLKLTDGKTILTSSEVCSTWFRAGSSEELYREKCESEIFGCNSQASYPSAKAMYQSYLQTQTQIVRVTRSSIRSFSCKRQSWNKSLYLKHALKSDYGAAWVSLPDGSILSCGGHNPSPGSDLWDVYLLLRGGEVNELTPMSESKKYHQCIFLTNAVYVFGGYSRSSTPCFNEKLEIWTWPVSRSALWKRLPDMLHPRSEVNPCGHGNCIYLFGKGSPELFHCVELTYTLLSVSLPSNSSVSGVFHNGEILLLEATRVTKWNLERNDMRYMSIVGQSGNVLQTESTAPIVVDNSLFVSDLGPSVRMIDLVSGIVTRYKFP